MHAYTYTYIHIQSTSGVYKINDESKTEKACNGNEDGRKRSASEKHNLSLRTEKNNRELDEASSMLENLLSDMSDIRPVKKNSNRMSTSSDVDIAASTSAHGSPTKVVKRSRKNLCPTRMTSSLSEPDITQVRVDFFERSLLYIIIIESFYVFVFLWSYD